MQDVRMRGFDARISVEEALGLVRRAVDPLALRREPEEVPLAEAAGRVLAREIRSRRDVPGFVRAAMDGWAVRGEDTFGASPGSPLRLEIVGESQPGAGFDGLVEVSRAVRIMTGAPIPEGADAVLPAEEGREADGGAAVLAEGSVPPMRHVAAMGEDIEEGALLLAAGRRLRPQDLGAAASAGWSRLPLIARHRVVVLATGDELVGPEVDPGPDETVDANSPMLDALVARDGGEAVLHRVPDGREPLEEAMQTAAAVGDLVLVSGASSVGAEDHAPLVLAERGELLFHGVAMRPSSPAGFGMLAHAPVFLLPGHPVSCLCAYDFFAGPALRRLAGLPEPWPYPPRRAPVARKVVSQLGRTDYVRVRTSEDGVVPVATSGAGNLSSTVRADGFLVVPADREGHAPGEEVTVHLYDPLPGEGP